MYIKRARVQLKCDDKSRTMQSEKQNCDINYILKKHAMQGIDIHKENLEANAGRYGDFIAAPEYHDAMNQILDAQNSFMELPSDVRRTFENDPAQFLAFAQDPENFDQMVEMGLADHAIEEKDPFEKEQPKVEPEKVKKIEEKSVKKED